MILSNAIFLFCGRVCWLLSAKCYSGHIMPLRKAVGWSTAVQTTVRASFCSKCPHQPPERNAVSFPPAAPVARWTSMEVQEVSEFHPEMEAVRVSAPQTEQSRAHLVNLLFKLPSSYFFCTVYLRIIPLCRHLSRVNPHLSMLKTCYWSCILQSSMFFGTSFFFFRHSVGHVPLQWWCCCALQGN